MLLLLSVAGISAALHLCEW